MRFVTVRLETGEEDTQTIPRTDLPPAVEGGPIHQLKLLDDDSVVQLRSVRGDLPACRELLAGNERVRSFSVIDQPGANVFAHFDPAPIPLAVLQWHRRVAVTVEMPIAFERGEPIATLVGEARGFSDAMATLPESVDYEVREIGRYSPRSRRPFHGLTDRQREILATAVDLGYYENPREATQADVGTALSVAPGTVGDHLRTIEAHVFSRGFESVEGE